MITERQDEIFHQVRDLISEAQGIKPDKISLESDLLLDLGIAGDDAAELLEEIDKRFIIDWNDLHLGIHFGNEGQGYPPPWMLKNDCSIFEHQPCSVRDLVLAAETGIWKGTPKILRPPAARATVYAISTLQFLIFAAIGLFVIAFVISKLFR